MAITSRDTLQNIDALPSLPPVSLLPPPFPSFPSDFTFIACPSGITSLLLLMPSACCSPSSRSSRCAPGHCRHAIARQVAQRHLSALDIEAPLSSSPPKIFSARQADLPPFAHFFVLSATLFLSRFIDDNASCLPLFLMTSEMPLRDDSAPGFNILFQIRHAFHRRFAARYAPTRRDRGSSERAQRAERV